MWQEYKTSRRYAIKRLNAACRRFSKTFVEELRLVELLEWLEKQLRRANGR